MHLSVSSRTWRWRYKFFLLIAMIKIQVFPFYLCCGWVIGRNFVPMGFVEMRGMVFPHDLSELRLKSQNLLTVILIGSPLYMIHSVSLMLLSPGYQYINICYNNDSHALSIESLLTTAILLPGLAATFPFAHVEYGTAFSGRDTHG
jgi:hypothetical protein